MRARAIRRPQPPSVRIRHMRLMVRRIEVLSIPAARENNRRPNPAGAILIRQLGGILAIAGREALAVLQAPMAQAGFRGLLGRRVAGEHAEAGLEGGHFAVFGGVGHVVDGHAAVLLQSDVGELRDALEGRVLGGLEVERGGPVVGEVFRVGAGGAGGEGGGVVFGGFHLGGVSMVKAWWD